MSTESPLTPREPSPWQLQAEIALLREIVYQMTQTLEAQCRYTERLDDLWHKHLLEAAVDAAYNYDLPEQPTHEDVWEVDQSRTDLNLTFRVEAP